MKGHLLIIKVLFFSLAFCMIGFSFCCADPLDSALKDWKPYVKTGKIMFARNNIIVVNEKSIHLVDTTRSGKTYKTEVLDIQGNVKSLNDVSENKYVILVGSLSTDEAGNKIPIARRIYLHDKKMTTDQQDEVSNHLRLNPPEQWK